MRILSVSMLALSLFIFVGCATLQPSSSTSVMKAATLHVPVTFETPGGWSISAQHITLGADDGSTLPAQMSAAKQNLNTPFDYASALAPINAANNSTYKLARSTDPVVVSDKLHWQDDGETTLSLYEGDRFILNYHYGVISPPEGVATHRSRSSYFHPLTGLDGEIFTEDFPTDHYHHRGFYFAWPGVHVGDQRYDMWHLIGMWTKFERILVKEEGPVFTELIIQNGWYDSQRKVMDEVMNLTVWHSDGVGQFMDVQYTWTPLVDIEIGPKDQKGYGGLNFRFPNRKNTVVTNIDGVQPTSDLKRSPWTDYSGVFKGQNAPSGVTIMNHPDNIDANPPWIIRAADDYGFLGISWPGIDTFHFVAGKTYTNQYRLFMHRGDSEDAMVKEAFAQFAQPQKLNIQR
ncbi:MAG: PmoA family protein [Candidatus Hinthialibacter antarcticus]|nr:PmoA family protein [Candidatus Hinthialibacter antarcticus]